MQKQVDFYFDYGSPTSYLAYAQLPGLARRTGATIHFKPVLLGGVLKATGNTSPMDVPAKNQWMRDDMAFFARRHGVRFKMNSHFPLNTLHLMRGAIHAQRQGFLDPYSDAIFRALWADDRNMGDPAVVAQVLNDAGIDAAALFEAIQTPEVKDALKEATEAAVTRGLFGAPVLYIEDQLFFGQDRIPYAEERLLHS